MPDTIASVLAYEADLTKTIQKTILRDLFVTEDKNAHTFRVKITRSGEPVDLTGATVTGYFMRYKDRISIPLTGTVEGSEAVLTLNDGCYSTRTMFCVTLCVALGGAKHAVFAGEGQMVLNRSDAIVDPENVIPSIEDIIAQYDLMVSGTNAANTAASSANTAAGNANAATSAANAAATNANNATARANTAAAALETAPVPTGTVVTYQAGTSATTPPTGTWLENPPTVPKGQYLWTRTVQSFTNGDPVTGYSVARQGMDGSGSVSSVNGVAPDTSGNVQLDTIANAQKLGGKEPSAYLDVRDLTADELTAMDTAARAALYADGARVLKVTNGETVVLLTLNAEGTTQWAGGEMPRNLLDNSYFAGPIVDGVKQGLVNQRGQTSYTGKENYTVDRWFIGASNTEVTIDESRVTATVTTGTAFPSLVQKVKNASRLAGKTLTFAARVYSNTTPTIRVQRNDIYLSYADGAALVDGVLVTTVVVPDDISDGELSVRAFARSVATLDYINIYWAALYEGRYTADTLPPHVPKENELWNCMKREVMLTASNGTQIFAIAKAWNTKSARAVFFLPVPMAEGTPTITFKNIRYLQLTVSGAYTTLVPTTATVVRTSGNVVEVQFTVSGAIAGETGFICANDTADAYIEFNKDL